MAQEKNYNSEYFLTSGVDDFRFTIESPPPPGYPGQRIADTYSGVPFEKDYEKRKSALLRHYASNPGPDNVKAHFHELARVALDKGPVHGGVLAAAADYINRRKDCSDFVMLGLMRMLFQFPASRLVSREIYRAAEDCILDFKYWPDEPGIDSMCSWTENHQIMFSVNEYLAGRLFPGRVFSNNGMSGQHRMERARPRILQWLELRFRTGFSEWLSNIYYDEDLTALVNLIDFSGDPELEKKASIIADVLLFDIASNSFRGQFACTHGRSYTREKISALEESTSDTSKLVFGTGVFTGRDNMSAVTLSLSQKYRPPAAVAAAGRDIGRPEFINMQRAGIRLKEARRWGLGFKKTGDLMVLLSQEAYVHPLTISPMVKLFDCFRWWDNNFFPEHRQLKPLLKYGRYLGLPQLIAKIFEKDLSRNLREENNIYTYRTPHYMLSSSQDYKKGSGGDQQHIWQAVLAPEAVCFTTHPGGFGNTSPLGYWLGSGFLPRTAQIKNTLIALYKIPAFGGILVPKVLPFTHAWLPREKFDEVIHEGHWAFARKGDSYLALFSSLKPRLRSDGEFKGRELIADGRRNAWICELGSAEENGSFENFRTALSGSAVEVKGLRVRYRSPSNGLLEYGWKGPLRQDGKSVPQRDYPRYDNPYCRSEFDSGEILIKCGGFSLELNFSGMKREGAVL